MFASYMDSLKRVAALRQPMLVMQAVASRILLASQERILAGLGVGYTMISLEGPFELNAGVVFAASPCSLSWDSRADMILRTFLPTAHKTPRESPYNHLWVYPRLYSNNVPVSDNSIPYGDVSLAVCHVQELNPHGTERSRAALGAEAYMLKCGQQRNILISCTSYLVTIWVNLRVARLS
jgi:hypothetical protein